MQVDLEAHVLVSISARLMRLQVLFPPVFRSFMTTDYTAGNRAQHSMMMSIMPGSASHCRAFKATCRTCRISGEC